MVNIPNPLKKIPNPLKEIPNPIRLLLNHYHQKKTTAKFSAEAEENYFQQYINSLNLTQGFPSTNGFNEFNMASLRTTQGFLNLKDSDKNPLLSAPDGTPLQERLTEDNEANRLIKEKINGALKLDANTLTAMNEYKASLETFNRKLTAKPPTIQFNTILNSLHAIKADAVTAIKNQQQEEKNRLTALFEARSEGGFVDKLKESLHITAEPIEPQIQKVKTDMLQALEKSHKTNLEKFTKDFDKDLKTVHKAVEDERNRIIFLARQCEDAEMRKIIEQIARENAQKKNPNDKKPAKLTCNGDIGSAELQNVSMKQLSTFKSVTGLEARKEGNAWVVNLSKWRPFYYNSARMDLEFLNLAQGIRAAGEESIEMEVIYAADKDAADEMGRRAFEACINAGFDPKKITIRVNGEVKTDVYDSKGNRTPGKLYEGQAKRHSNALQRAAEIKEEKSQWENEPLTEEQTKHFKERLQSTTTPPPAPLPAPDAPVPDAPGP